jgi:plastocyanin
VGQQSAQLRDFVQGTYSPINVSERIYQDMRNQTHVTVRLESGECFDPKRMYISLGTRVSWVNEDKAVQYLDIDGDGQNFTPIEPAESFFRDFSTLGDVAYHCSEDGTTGQEAQVSVVNDDDGNQISEKFFEFINGSFALGRGMGIDGWVVFEAPEGTKFRDLRWLAGDSITVTF